ncbi:TPA: type VI secretion system contractile sheath large subunit, partial [Candidatus Latescibacteria bacterium]|nr:type VI secretion system contractile sheath large subunit [Candidatus Latescibacterota bacterium]
MAEEAEAEGAAVAEEDLSPLEKIVQKGKMARDESQVPYSQDLVGEFVGQVLDESMTANPDTAAMINARIAEIDQRITDQLNEVMHAPEFQKMEGTWRGLNYLVMNTETSTGLKLRLLNVTRNELQNDLEKATEFDQSNIFKMVYEDEYGTFGGAPFSCLIGDYEFGRHPQDIALLEKISQVAAAAHAPFVAAAGPKLFD